MITIDFSKAFDTMSHDKFLIKLYSFNWYVVKYKILGWIEDFLTDRSFNVVLKTLIPEIIL